ncbi:MAG TPA: hypothetical protein VH186_05945 [Chloroflexia bacterium]|nr:hypothetical protein [Chloroflexia bacterium]
MPAIATRRYVVYGRLPLKRTPQSGLFTTKFKEDAFFVELNDRALVLNSGARTEQSYEIPLFYFDKGYFERRRMIESVGFTGAHGLLELYVQFAMLPLLDPASLDNMRQEILERADYVRRKLALKQDQQTRLDMLLLEWCNEPIILFDFDRTTFTMRLKVRAPLPAPLPVSARTRRGLLNYYNEYEDLLCSKAGYYIISAFETLPSLQQIDLSMLRMEREPVNGITLSGPEEIVKQHDFGLKRVDPAALPVAETDRQRKAREKAERKEAKQQEKLERLQLKALSKEKQRLAFTQREPDPFDELFDGTLSHESTLLSVRIPRQGFMQMQRSKQTYSARRALELFECHLNTDEEATTIYEVESFI